MYDIRGVYPREINRNVARKVGRALGTFLKGETVVVGRDNRYTSRRIFNSFVQGILDSGTDVISIGIVPNPVNYFFAFEHKIFGAYITASHNPAEYTGFKLIKPNGVSFVSELREVEKIFRSKKFQSGRGCFEERDGLKDYTNFLSKRVGRVDGRVVVETFGGVGVIASEILRFFGMQTKTLHEKLDDKFFGFRPDPSEKNLKSLISTVRSGEFDFGVAFDGDADRSVFIDNRGRELNGSLVSAIFLKEILKKRTGKVVLTADCASELKTVVKKYKGTVVWWRVGHGFIEDKLVRENALFAGEQSSHFYFNEFYPFSDGILAAIYLAKTLKGKRLSSIVDKIKFSPMVKFYIDVGSELIKKKIVKLVRSEHPNAISIMDGIKIELNEREWVLIRESQTLPEVNICIQAKDRKRLKELKQKYTRHVLMKLNYLKSR